MRHFAVLVLFALAARAEEIPVVGGVEPQPLHAQVARLTEALNMLGDPLLAGDLESLRKAATPEQVQRILDRHCLVSVNINPEGRLSVLQGPAAPELEEKGWRTFLVKVHNEAGTTAVLGVDSPNAGQLANRPGPAVARSFLDLNLYTKPPMKRVLSGLAVEYGILQLSSRDAGKREAKLIFDAGQGSQDLAFRNQVDILFTVKPATKVTFHVKDQDGKPATAGFVIRDAKGRVYPSQAKRLAPDFFFQTQIYRADGESILLPRGEFTVEYGRGPEYRTRSEHLTVGAQPAAITARLERWIDPARLGWYSGDHHIHAAGCAHYEKPTEGVYPQDMMRHILGEDLKIGSVLTWGPGWYFQKTFFEGKDNKLSTPDNLMHYDVEVSGFPSSHTGHIVLLGLHEQDYPGTKRIEEWPSWGLPVFRWAKKQGAVAGFAHSGWGLALKQEKLLTDEIPPFDGIGANEYIVGVTHDLVDFISTVDTPYANELNIWYHTLNVGYRTKISGETDFPCIYDGKVGLGRSYVHQTKSLDYADWVAGIKEGRNYVSDGKSHLIDFRVNGTPMGQELKLAAAGTAHITAQVAALLREQPDESIRRLPYDKKPYWDVERARIGDTRTVPVELIVNGVAVARKVIAADGSLRPIDFDYKLDRSSWVALRILPSSHTNPVFVVVNGKPIRSKESAEWCLKAVDQCWKQKAGQIRLSERGEAEQAYEYARQMYRARLKEAF